MIVFLYKSILVWMNEGFSQHEDASVYGHSGDGRKSMNRESQYTPNPDDDESNHGEWVKFSLENVPEEQREEAARRLEEMDPERRELLFEFTTRWALAKKRFLTDFSIEDPSEVIDDDMLRVSEEALGYRYRSRNLRKESITHSEVGH